jgi:hypothetical protein
MVVAFAGDTANAAMVAAAMALMVRIMALLPVYLVGPQIDVQLATKAVER